MAIVKRAVKGSALTHAELDGNFDDLDQRLIAVVAGMLIATQAEAEAGSNTTKLMTPQRVSQAITALGAMSPAAIVTAINTALGGTTWQLGGGGGVTVVNDLTTGGTTSALSAQQGVVLKSQVDGKQATLGVADATALNALVDSRATTVANAIVTALVGAAPTALNTLVELATALGNDANFATTVTNSLALKANAANSVLTGLTRIEGTTVTLVNVLTVTSNAAVVDVARQLNQVSHNANLNVTFSGTPAQSNQWFGLRYINTDASNPHTLTFPSAFSVTTSAARTSFVVPPSGRANLAFCYDGSAYYVFGDTPFLNKFDFTTDPGPSNDVSQGFGPGSLGGNSVSGALFWCESNAPGAAVWNAVTSSGTGVTDGDKGDIVVSGTGATWTIDAGVVTLAKMANMATASLLGRNTAGTGAPEVLSATQATALLNVATTALKGLVPATGGGTTNFLRADMTFAAPPGGTSNPLFWETNDFVSNAADDIDPFSVIALATGSLAALSGNVGLNAGHPGILEFRSSTSANSGVKCWTNSPIRLEAGGLYKIVLVPRELATLNGHIGFNDSLSISDPSNGVYWNCVNGVFTPRVQAQDTSTNVSGTAYSGVALADAAWVYLDIEVLTTSTTRFRILNASGTEVYNEVVNGAIPVQDNRECYVQMAFWTSAAGTARPIVDVDKVGFGDTSTTAPTRF